MAVQVVLIEPEIPQNTEILHALALLRERAPYFGPMGFSLDEKHVRRAGLDYWKDLTLYMYESVEELYQNTRREIFGIFFKGAKELRSGGLFGGLFLVFGKETAGLPKGLLDRNAAGGLHSNAKRAAVPEPFQRGVRGGL